MTTHEPSHASFFSGVGGLDLGLERAGWRTVSFSEIDPYASAVLAERWPDVPNLGDIVSLARGREDVGDAPSNGADDWRQRANAAGVARHAERDSAIVEARRWNALERDRGERTAERGDDSPIRRGASRTRRGQRAGELAAGAGAANPGRRVESAAGGDAWQHAILWSGGFPCQDLSVAGKRRGFAGERSALAFAFLHLVERHRPPAILFENVPGLLSSHAGRDFGALLGRLGELGYWWAYRILDAQHFGVPQRRRRVFVVAIHARTGLGADSPAAVLSVGARCGGHSAESDEARSPAASLTGGGADSPQSERIFDPDGAGPSLDTGRAVPNVIAGTLTGPSPNRGWPQLENATDGYLIPGDGSAADPDGVREG